jgi:hypothetical protein
MWRSFSERVEWIQNWYTFYKKEIVFCAIIFLTASLSFGLGYLANHEFNHAPIVIEKCSHIGNE